MKGRVLRRFAVSVVGAALLAVAITSYGATAREISYRNGDVVLSGTLSVPDIDGPVPAVVFQGGSGKSPRGSPWANAVAAILLEQGVAVLQPDKRGSGKSTGRWENASFEELAQDLLAGVEDLRGRPKIAANCVGVAGLSQGGRVVAAAAASSSNVAFVVNMSGSAVSFVEQAFHELANTARHAGLTEPQVAEVVELNRAAGKFLLNADWDEYRAARDHGMAQSWGSLARGFPADRDDPRWAFLRTNYRFDPMTYWLVTPQPVLILYGADDERDNVPVAESVRRLEFGFSVASKTNYRIVVVPGAGHSAGMLERGDAHAIATDALREFVDDHATCEGSADHDLDMIPR